MTTDKIRATLHSPVLDPLCWISLAEVRWLKLVGSVHEMTSTALPDDIHGIGIGTVPERPK